MNRRQPLTTPATALLVPGLLTLSICATWALAQVTEQLRHPAVPAFDSLLCAAAAWLLVACTGWAALICAAALLEASTAGRIRATTWTGCPPAARRALLAGLGVALATAPGQASSPAWATGPMDNSRQPSAGQALPAPARPLGAAPRPPRVVVRTGDTLWHLAADRLPRASRAIVVADFVDRLHHRNRDVIGPDPDLILPGERLVIPALTRRPHTRHLEEH
jgi:hypothetical protein